MDPSDPQFAGVSIYSEFITQMLLTQGETIRPILVYERMLEGGIVLWVIGTLSS